MQRILFFLTVLTLISIATATAQSKTLSQVRQVGDELVYTNSYPVTGWVTGTFYNIIPAGTLAAGGVYQVQLSYSQSGLDVIEQVYTIPMTLTYPSAPAIGITGQVINYSGTSRQFQPRYRPGGVSNVSWGVEVTPSENGMSSTLLVTVLRKN